MALVTGASRGIGAATALALAEAGCAVACAARSTDESPQRTPGTLDAVVRRIVDDGGRAVAVPTDLSDPGQIEPMVATTVAALGVSTSWSTMPRSPSSATWNCPTVDTIS